MNTWLVLSRLYLCAGGGFECARTLRRAHAVRQSARASDARHPGLREFDGQRDDGVCHMFLASKEDGQIGRQNENMAS